MHRTCASPGRFFIGMGRALCPLSVTPLLAAVWSTDGSLSQSKALAGCIVRRVYGSGNAPAPVFSSRYGAGGADVFPSSPQLGSDGDMAPFRCLFFLPSTQKEWKETERRSIINAGMMRKRRTELCCSTKRSTQTVPTASEENLWDLKKYCVKKKGS